MNGKWKWRAAVARLFAVLGLSLGLLAGPIASWADPCGCAQLNCDYETCPGGGETCIIMCDCARVGQGCDCVTICGDESANPCVPTCGPGVCGGDNCACQGPTCIYVPCYPDLTKACPCGGANCSDEVCARLCASATTTDCGDLVPCTCISGGCYTCTPKCSAAASSQCGGVGTCLGFGCGGLSPGLCECTEGVCPVLGSSPCGDATTCGCSRNGCPTPGTSCAVSGCSRQTDRGCSASTACATDGCKKTGCDSCSKCSTAPNSSYNCGAQGAACPGGPYTSCGWGCFCGQVCGARDTCPVGRQDCTCRGGQQCLSCPGLCLTTTGCPFGPCQI